MLETPNGPSSNVAAPGSDAVRPLLIEAEDVRVDVEGVPALDGLTLRSAAEHVLILGAPQALFDALTGLRPVTRGALRIRGVPSDKASRDRIVAGAPLDPRLPGTWNALEYVTWSARLVGHSASEARKLAHDALGRVQFTSMATNSLERLLPHARRGVVLAAAIATDARVLVLEDPLAGLPEEIARTWARIIVEALKDRDWIALSSRIPLTSPLAMNADDAIVVSASRVVAQGPPAEIAAAERRFVARIHGPLEALAACLGARGVEMKVDGAQVRLDLGPNLTTAELLALCTEVDATVVELIPVARALT